MRPSAMISQSFTSKSNASLKLETGIILQVREVEKVALSASRERAHGAWGKADRRYKSSHGILVILVIVSYDKRRGYRWSGQLNSGNGK
jgi:hypothetical protein